MVKNWTPSLVAMLLQNNDLAVERAMVTLYERQTLDEKQTSDTKHTNQRGFNCAHASKGSYYARWVKSGKHLTGHHLEKARAIALRYTRQLTEQANLNEKKKVEEQRERFRPTAERLAREAFEQH